MLKAVHAQTHSGLQQLSSGYMIRSQCNRTAEINTLVSNLKINTVEVIKIQQKFELIINCV